MNIVFTDYMTNISISNLNGNAEYLNPAMFYSYISHVNNFVSYQQWNVHVCGVGLVQAVVRFQEFRATDKKLRQLSDTLLKKNQ